MKPTAEQPSVLLPHLLTMSERTALQLTGVQDVDSFDDETVVATTTCGELTIKGQRLHIQHLNLETGDLAVEGTVDSLLYAPMQTHRGGFFGRLFR